MSGQQDVHSGLHSERGASAGEHPGRARDPVVKVLDLAWLEFDKPDLAGAETFAHAFGFATAHRTADEVWLRGTDVGSPSVLIRRGARSRFVGPAFQAGDAADLLRLATATDSKVAPLPESLGGSTVDLVDPSGLRVRVVAGTHRLPALPGQRPQVLNLGHDVVRVNSTQRPPRAPARVQRLGHVVVQTTKYRETLDWYLRTLGMIVSDFLYYPGQRERGPVMSFIRCDLGSTPADHHTLALTLGPSNRYVHSAYQVADLDALAAGSEYLRERGYRRSWGIGRHIQGSQIFDYWRDPDGFMVEHFSDGDMFDCTVEPGWAPMSASGLAQWGPPATKDFLGISPGAESLREVRAIVDALREDNEFDLRRLRGLLKVANS
ncbi:VOC family protein [Nocardia amikacinitolerans]|uniref:VOC family protein n=1 Tax=Nocardia amikacinitolerans TaxID=756689 RepID=UPI0036B92E09